MVKIIRENHLKKERPSLGIVDAKSIKNVDTAQEKGYDGGKKVSGIKLHIVVDTLGLPHALLVTPANAGDRAGAEEMISLNLDSLSATNAPALELGMVAYNILRVTGQESLRKKDAPMKRKTFRQRLRTVIENLIMMAFRLTSYTVKLTIGLGYSNPWRETFSSVLRVHFASPPFLSRLSLTDSS